MASDHCDVLIAGAGPTGLMLACLLRRSGVDVRLIEASPAPPAGSRGKGLQPRSLELFDDLGMVERITANGIFGLPISFHDEAGNAKVENLYEKRVSRPDAPYLKSLLIPQWRVEEALCGRLEELGGRVEFGLELTGFEQDDGHVAALATGASGSTSIQARWLVGCDGGKSTVRRLAGIAFLGETLEALRMLVGDFKVAGLDRTHWHIWRSAEGFLALCPLPSTDLFQLQASIALGQDSETTIANAQRLVERRSGRADIRLGDPGWMSLWRANVRMVDRYRAGRVFLAGDAAHVHSPAGGQGMNTGIQDACNLAWKLAAAIGGADASLLDTYQEERLPIAAWVLGISNELMASAAVSRTIVFRRDEATLQLGLGYRGSSLSREMRQDGEGLRAGDRAPQAPGLIGPNGPCTIFDLLRGPQVALLGFGTRWQKLIDACETRFAGQVKGYVLSDAPGDPRHYRDAEGHARAAFAEDALFIIRPDNYVGLATEVDDSGVAIDYLSKLVG